MKERVSIIAPFGVDREQAFVILSMRVLDDNLQVFSTRRDGSELCVEQSEQRVPLLFLSIIRLFVRLAGFFIAAVMGLWLLIGIIRSGRLR